MFVGSGNKKDKNLDIIRSLELENNILKKARFLPDMKEDAFIFIYTHKDIFPIQTMCRLLNVSSSGYYKYAKKVTSPQQLKHHQITKLIKSIFVKHGPNIGSPFITDILNRHELIASPATVARILKDNKEKWISGHSDFHLHKDVQLHFHNKDTFFDINNRKYYSKTLAKNQIDDILQANSISQYKKYTVDHTTTVDSFDPKDNLLIHGENLSALYKLKDFFSRRVKLIYVDLPFNTERYDLSYHDNYSRSDYLLFLQNRFEIAKDLLKRNGSIFIHCDDREQAYIKVLCDEIFGEYNFISQIIWRRTNGQQNRGHIAKVKDYILVYAKDKKHLSLNHPKISTKQLESYKYKDQKGKYRTDKILNKRNGYYTYSIDTPSGIRYHNRWNYSKASFQDFLDNNAIHWSQNDIPYKKVYLKENPTSVVTDLWVTEEYGTTREATIELQSLIGENHFTYPKPLQLLKHIINLASNENDIVLDFFAGSGTTAVAAATLNRQFLSVELEEDNFNLMVKRLQHTLHQESSFHKQSFITCKIE